MAILMPDAPPGVTAAFLKGISSLLAGEDSRRKERYVGEQTKIPTRTDVGDTRDRSIVHHPQHVFWIGANAAAQSEGMPKISSAGWRCFAGATPDTVVMGRVTRRGPDQWKMTSMTYGEWAWAVVEATQDLEELPEVRKADYELRVLTLAALSMEAFWLVSQTEGVKDLVVPFRGPGADSRRSTDACETLPNFLAWIRPQALTALHGRDLHGPRAV